ncbi:MAG: hypothetical protein WDM71_10615 [Ferruginibacter sp.]
MEKVAEQFFAGQKEEALRLFQQIKDHHLDMLKYLVTVNWLKAEDQLRDFFYRD